MNFSLRRAALAALAAVMLANCSGGSGAGTGAGAPLVMARVKDAVNLDPWHANDGLSFNVDSEVMESFVGFKPGTFEVVPQLAASWKSNAAGTVWTFKMRPGAKFSDGTPVDAAAIKFNYDRARLRSDPMHGNFSYPYYDDYFGQSGEITDVEAPDPSTVVFKLAHPLGPFLRDLAMQAFGIGSPTAIRTDPKGFEQKPIGSGPYMVAEWVRDDHITLVPNKLYNGSAPKPTFQTVIIRDIPDQATSVLSLEKGDIQMLTDPRQDDAKTLAAQPKIRIVDQPSNNVTYVAFDTEKKPFDDVRVRRAIAYALDPKAIATGLYAPGTTVGDNLTPPGMLGENPGVKIYPHDPAKAKALLAQAGLPNGFTTSLFYPTAPRPYMPEPQRLAETIQAELKQAGITVTLEPLEFGVFLDRVKNGEHEMCLIGWTGDNGDPDNFMYQLLDEDSAHKGTANNYSFWRDPKYHELMIAGQRTIDEAKRKQIYMQANALIHDQVPLVSLVHTVVPIALSTSIEGFVPSPDTRYHFELIKPAGAK